MSLREIIERTFITEQSRQDVSKAFVEYITKNLSKHDCSMNDDPVIVLEHVVKYAKQLREGDK